MKRAGVSLMAAASPIPMPTQRVRPVVSSQASVRTRASSTRFTWPKLMVSRTGSNSASAHAARAHPYQPYRRSSGPAVIHITAPSAARLSSSVAAMAARSPRCAIGSMLTAANGG